MVSATEQLELFELHVCVRDYCFAREDRLVGVSVMRLSDIAEQVVVYSILYKMLMYFNVVYNHES